MKYLILEGYGSLKGETRKVPVHSESKNFWTVQWNELRASQQRFRKSDGYSPSSTGGYSGRKVVRVIDEKS